MDEAVRRWAMAVAAEWSQVCGIAYFGSYARGDWGVGSDIDLVIVVDGSDAPFWRRAAAWDVTELPVPADVLVYTRDEWEALRRHGRFADMLRREAVWVHRRHPEGSAGPD